MKANVFISVVAFHIVVIAGLYLLSACSTKGGPGAADTAPAMETAESNFDQFREPSRPQDTANFPTVADAAAPSSILDPAFNSGSDLVGVRPSSNLVGGSPAGQTTLPTGSTVEPPEINEFPEDEEAQQAMGLQPAPVAEVVYKVEKGDSLWKISRKYKVSLNELLVANGLTEQSTLQIGQNITIPTQTPIETPPGTLTEMPIGSSPGGSNVPEVAGGGSDLYDRYTVVRGDTLSGIAQRFNTTLKDIKTANGLNSDIIQLNQVLAIPVNSVSNAPPPAVNAPAPATTTTPAPGSEGIVHLVQPGETPGGIAKKYGITTAQLMEDNGITDPRKLYAGKELQIRLSDARPLQPPSAPPLFLPAPATPSDFDEAVFDDLQDIPEVEVVPQ